MDFLSIFSVLHIIEEVSTYCNYVLPLLACTYVKKFCTSGKLFKPENAAQMFSHFCSVAVGLYGRILLRVTGTQVGLKMNVLA
jgi:hypothetical protein